MNHNTKSIIEILKKPADYSIERVSRAMTEILEVTREYYTVPGQAFYTCAAGGEQNG